MKFPLNIRVDFARWDQILIERARMQSLWDLVKQPLKFPARRRRSDREVPKAA